MLEQITADHDIIREMVTDIADKLHVPVEMLCVEIEHAYDLPSNSHSTLRVLVKPATGYYGSYRWSDKYVGAEFTLRESQASLCLFSLDAWVTGHTHRGTTPADVPLHISTLYHQPWRGKGIGQVLHKARIRIAYECCYALLLAEVRTDNEKQLHIMQKYGWEKLTDFQTFPYENSQEITHSLFALNRRRMEKAILVEV